MLRNIFVKSDNNIKSYLVIIDEERLRETQNKIDSHAPKSDLQTGVFSNESVIENLLNENEKWQIVEKATVGNHLICKYYICQVHPLSRICNQILNAGTSIELSIIIKELFEYVPKNERDLSYYHHLISAFNFAEVNINLIANASVSNKTKRNVLKTIQDSFAKIYSPHDTLELSQDFEEAFAREIEYQETQISEYKYTSQEINVTRKRVLHQLPTDDKLFNQ